MRSNAARPPRDKPDYHVHIRPQTETSAGPHNCREVSPRGNTQVGRELESRPSHPISVSPPAIWSTRSWTLTTGLDKGVARR
jgi:hypothetical protein